MEKLYKIKKKQNISLFSTDFFIRLDL